MNMDRIKDKLREVLYMMNDIKGTVYAEYNGTEYDEDYIDDIMEQLDDATDAIHRAITLV